MKKTKKVILVTCLIAVTAAGCNGCKVDEPDETQSEYTTVDSSVLSPEDSMVTNESIPADESIFSESSSNKYEAVARDAAICVSVGFEIALKEWKGGNPDSFTEIKITVSENRYYYNNSEISFDELLEIISNLNGNDTIVIHDDYASDKAFDELTTAINERGISYTIE